MHYLTVDEMLQAATDSKMPTAEICASRVKDLAAEVGRALALHLGCQCKHPDEDEDPYFSGTVVGFNPPADNPDMPVPFCIASHDKNSLWLEENGSAPDPDIKLENYVVCHFHNGGSDTYTVSCGHHPTPAEAIKALKIPFKEEQDDQLTIHLVTPTDAPVIIPEVVGKPRTQVDASEE